MAPPGEAAHGDDSQKLRELIGAQTQAIKGLSARLEAIEGRLQTLEDGTP